ncbi:MAG: hypothetical protein KGI59_02825 [Patescibacteria group bacterium]|nr:hypothetical protein [Patescibacteria group bacterium]MDE2172620.1 hypothetical protein [Patescibacteria group bacterium]
MNIITVIPLGRTRGLSALSYFTSADVPIGAIVAVPLRARSVHAVVTKTEPAADLKLGIKGASFEIKKLSRVKAAAFFPAPFMEAASRLADYYATSVGAIINSLISEAILDQSSKIQPPLPRQPALSMEVGARADGLKVRPLAERVFAIQGDDADRLSAWRSLIRQEFARRKSIAIYLPTLEECRKLYRELEKGIEGYIFALNSGLTRRQIGETWAKIADSDHPIVVIATPSFALLPRGDIETVIVERENARGWITPKEPYIDLRHALELVSSAMRQTVFLADSMLRTETLQRLDTGDIDAGSPFKWRSLSDARDTLIDMKSFKASENAFRILSPDLESLIRQNHEHSTHLFVMTLRRGAGSLTVCQDCETIVTCRNCSSPVVLHVSAASGKNFYMCHTCGERRSADEVCDTCGGWRLNALGIGIDRVYEEVRLKFPGIDVFRVDADTTKNEKDVAAAMRQFSEKPGSILLGTELALLRLPESIDHVAVVSLDSLFALPDFRIDEKIMYTLVRLRAVAKRSILVQTRKAEKKVFEYGLKGNLSDFYRQTIAERKKFAYPPFFVLLKFTIEGAKPAIAEAMARVQNTFERQEIDVFPAFTATVRGKSVIHGLLKIEAHAWPDPEIIAKIRSLPPQIRIRINPESLL